MTNQEAIVELRDLISDDRTDKENEALLIAIEAVREMNLIKFNVRALNELLKEADNDSKGT